MDQDNEELEDEGQSGGGGLQIEVIKSYLSFARRAFRRHWIVIAVLMAVGFTLTHLANRFMPRQFDCTTILMAEQNPLLDGYGTSYAFQSAANLITRRENIEALVKEIKLVEKAAARRPPILKLKDDLREAILGPMDQATKEAVQIGTLESRLQAGVDNSGNLRVSAQWTDPKTAAEIAEAAREGFVRARHTIEMSRYTDKMSVLAAHAERAQEQMNSLKEQVKAARNSKQLPNSLKGVPASGAATASAPATPRPAPTVRKPLTDDLLPTLKEKLSESKQKLAGLQADQENRVREERRKLQELRLRYTSEHPEFVMQEQRLRMIEQTPAEITVLRTEIERMSSQIEQREALTRAPGGGGAGKMGSTAESDAQLPADIIALLDDNEIDGDPILRSQLTDSALRYTMLKNDIASTRIQLDTAQVAFNARYKIVVPAAPPGAPFAPNPVAILGGGIAVTLLLSLILPLILELRSGIIVARWQVDLVSLPVLAELHLPPYSAD